MHIAANSRQTQRGAVLVVGLIMLVVISLMGAVAYGVSTQQERISGNTRDRMRAFEAAEAALRDCEAYLANPATVIDTSGTVPGVTMAAAPGTAQLSDTPTTAPLWKNAASVRVLGTALTNVAVPPSCLIEQMLDMWVPETGGAASEGALRRVTIFRVTATGFGTRPDTTTKVQSTFRRL